MKYPVFDATHIGEAIRDQRKEQGLSQKQLAEQAGLPQNIISRIETGKEGTRVDRLLRVMAHLGMQFVIIKQTDGLTMPEDD